MCFRLGNLSGQSPDRCLDEVVGGLLAVQSVLPFDTSEQVLCYVGVRKLVSVLGRSLKLQGEAGYVLISS